MATLKLDPNKAVFGTVKYMDYWPAKTKDGKEYSAQISLKGKWDGTDDDAVIYLPHQLANDILATGLAHQDGEKVFNGVKVPKFHWDYDGRVQVLKADEGGTKRTTVLAIDEAAPTVAAAPTPPAAAGRPPAPTTTVPHTNDEWAALERGYARAQALALKAWGENYDPQALVAATAAIWIEANKRGIKLTDTGYEEMPPAIVRGQKNDNLPW